MAKNDGPRHTTIYRGHWVKVRLKDGTEFTARFKERKAKWVHFQGRPPVRRSEIALFVAGTSKGK
jgi:hypothetical protein